MMSSGVLLSCAQYGPTDRLAYPWMEPVCEGGSALLYLSLKMVKLWYALGISWLIRNTAVSPV